MRILSLFDFSGYMMKPWFEAGHETIGVDTLHFADVGKPFVPSRNWFTHRNNWDLSIAAGQICATHYNAELILAFPPCTDLAVSGAKHFEKKRLANPQFQEEAVKVCRLAERIGNTLRVPWMVENPLGVLCTKWRKPDWTFHPHQYGGMLTGKDRVHPDWPDYVPAGDAYPKRTGIWCGNGFHMPDEVPVRMKNKFGKACSFLEWQQEDWDQRRFSPQFKKLGGTSLKTKLIRSLTPRGFAAAVHAVNDPDYGV